MQWSNLERALNCGVFPFSHGLCLYLPFLDICVLCGRAFFLDDIEDPTDKLFRESSTGPQRRGEKAAIKKRLEKG